MCKVVIKKSKRKEKKLMAIFTNCKSGVTKTTHFGATGYSDYTIHGDPERKMRYLNRHRKNENWEDPFSAGSLAMYILWNKPTLKSSIYDYKKHFGFN
jgi:ABC-type sulfate transport system substrate-binding protein